MIIEKLDIMNFRNYDSLNIKLHPNLNVFIGKNGMGKTNILESIYFLAITKSYRTSMDKKMIQTSKKIAKVRGKIRYESFLNKVLEINLTETSKTALIDNNEEKRMSSYISNLNVVIFSPETIELLKGSPQIRRKFLNIEIGQINNKYLKNLNIYNNVLKTRNEYLKKIADSRNIDEIYFEILTNKLIDSAIVLYDERRKFLDMVNEKIDIIYKKISEIGTVRIKYITGFNDFSIEYMRFFLKEKYKTNLIHEIDQGATLFGPHRDDFIFVLNDKDIKNYGSQGQQRALLLSLKLAEVDIFKEITKTPPVLLLDDIFSELDRVKRKNVLDYIENGVQIILTTTEIDKRKLLNANLYTVADGRIVKYEEVKMHE